MKFEIILADPPWFYNSRANKETSFRGGARSHYDLMKDADLLALPVNEIAAERSVLFLWATWPRLDFALQLIAAWGFTYKTCGFDWFKVNLNGGLFHGVGYYSKSNSEPCLLATKGQPLKPATHDVSMALEDFEQEAFKALRREHSRKPEEVHNRIERMYPTARKLEMFSRRQRPQWVSWGNETNHVPLIETLTLQPIAEPIPQKQQVSMF